ncbi:hypothetical protein [Actinoplanes sp. NPDC051494]|uniref:hypothetical protein n=1 Tax=Actinoplanes sp. NPDC051494 TaxID=3363907 RepID=UPI0037A204D8
MTWHVLAQGGLVVRGPNIAELGVRTDWPALARRTRENLALGTYGDRWHRIIREALRIRLGGPGPLYRNPLRRHADVVAVMTHVLR